MKLRLAVLALVASVVAASGCHQSPELAPLLPKGFLQVLDETSLSPDQKLAVIDKYLDTRGRMSEAQAKALVAMLALRGVNASYSPQGNGYGSVVAYGGGNGASNAAGYTTCYGCTSH